MTVLLCTAIVFFFYPMPGFALQLCSTCAFNLIIMSSKQMAFHDPTECAANVQPRSESRFTSRVTILTADRLNAVILEQMVRDVLPRSEIRALHLTADVFREAEYQRPELLIVGTSISGCDLIELLTRFTASCSSSRAFVVTGQKEICLLVALRSLPIAGIFDPIADSPAQFEVALHAIATGRGYWSASVLDQLYLSNAHESIVCRTLTLTEQIVLAVIGGGCDDISAGGELGLKPSTIQSVRKKLHRKLEAQHKGDLIRRAAQYGFVRFTHKGVERPGFSSLLERWRSRHAGSFPSKEDQSLD